MHYNCIPIFLWALTCLATCEFCDKDNCASDNVIRNCHMLNHDTFNLESPTIMFGEPQGRFGNQLLGYAVLHQLQEELGIKCYITKETKDFLLKFYTPESITLPIFNETFCNAKDIRFIPYNGPFADLLNEEEYRKGKIMQFYPGGVDAKTGKLVGGYRPEDHISKDQEKFQKKYVKHIRNNMVLANGMSAKAQRRLLGLARKRKLKPKDVTFIGVHARKTDHEDFMKTQHDLDPIEDDYYNDAIEYYRENYYNCIFVVGSDDINWCKEHIDASQGDVFFSESNPTFHKDEYDLLMDDDMSKAAYDLALLTSCNHTVISRGTYSLWVAMLAGGEFGGEYYTEYGSIVPPDLMG